MEFKPLGLVVGIFFTGVLVILAISFLLGQLNALMVRQEYGDRIASLCTTSGGSVANAAYAPAVPKPWRALVLHGDEKHAWMGDLRQEVQADGKDKIDVVVCVSDKRKQLLEQCTF